MLCLRLESNDPFFNLAADEYLLKSRREDFLVLSVNSPSVIIGKHQVAHREIDTAFTDANNIPLLRRISGGGAVFHDEGNLNFSFILQSTQGHQVDFQKYTRPVIEFLLTLGVDARFEGKNDLKVDGRKISGNAEHVFRQRVLHHGTLLFATNLQLLRNSLRKDASSYSTKGVSSNPSPVMNLNEILPGMSMNDFTTGLLEFFLRSENGNSLINLTPQENLEILSISESKYRKWDWNYAYGPEYTLSRKFSYNEAEHQLSLSVRDGIIRDCKIDGTEPMASIAKKMTGHRHMPGDLEQLLKGEFANMGRTDIYSFF
jgi:lipoate---protein ligase